MFPIALIILSFISGSLPFSVWVVRIFLNQDVRQFGDGNPGATNAFKAGSPLLGLCVLLLDISKAALPVGLSYFQLGIQGLPMIIIATAPLLGHMYSPFLGFKGGKGLATALGVWIGLTTWQLSLPAIIGVVLGWLVLSPTGWSVMLAMAAILVSQFLWLPMSIVLGVWALQTALLAWSHREDLKQAPTFFARLKQLNRNKEGN
jgi:glycerol-3-phosphate acyltransferase PlsY